MNIAEMRADRWLLLKPLDIITQASNMNIAEMRADRWLLLKPLDIITQARNMNIAETRAKTDGYWFSHLRISHRPGTWILLKQEPELGYITHAKNK